MADKPEKSRPIPKPANGIQVNFCKNPACGNFGIPASGQTQSRGGKFGQDKYIVRGSSHGSALECRKCGEFIPIKSNQGVYEELKRISAYLEPKPLPSCPNPDCTNSIIYVGTSIALREKCYSKFGTTKSGSQRYRCNSCGKTFAIPTKEKSPIARHTKSHLNYMIFRSLVRKQPLRCIAETVGVHPKTVFDKMDFFYRQCLAFAASRERDIPSVHIERLYVAVDRQEHIVNWTDRKSRKNVTFQAVGSADCTTGYIFGMHVNYDRSLNPDEVREESLCIGDYENPSHMTKYARVWLPEEYSEQAKSKKPVLDESEEDLSLREKIKSRYDEAASRDDVEAGEIPSENTKTPPKGMLVRPEYTLYAHFLFLKKMFRNVDKVRFYTDQESGIRAACLSAFWEEVLDKRCDMFYVSIKKNYTIDEKRQMANQGKRELKEFREKYLYLADLRDTDIQHMIIVDRIKKMREIGKWKDRWLEFPFPSMDEPEKQLCYLTNIKKERFDYEEGHLARLFMKGTLRAIDRFFMQTRRRTSALERPFSSSANRGRKWYLYNFYDPYNVIKLLEIYRVYYNYVKVGNDKKTPAMRLGLAKGPCTLEDILCFTEKPKNISSDNKKLKSSSNDYSI